eukprot:GFUD01015989.1.p1 GENE.GFUD01015989.1~~GFUD01015989.1.p1  ORF type:complete len:254 (+),score=79.30 GFUD01015989.1:27-764(+)
MLSVVTACLVLAPWSVLAVTDWKNVNLRAKELPGDIEELANKVVIEQENEKIYGVNTFYQTAEPPVGVARSGKVVLLLHGAAFSSQTWVTRVPTIATLAALGHGVIAIDLPGFGRTRSSVSDKGEYLANVIDTLSPTVKPVVITPSASGAFIFPMLRKYPNKLSGWVPVAPAGTTSRKEFYEKLTVPTMIVFGGRDFGARRSNTLLSQIPTSTSPQELPNAGHPAYLDKPDLWHQLLLNFLDNLQ